MPVYTLPDLPYDYSALEPFISGKIMELHHDKHHQAYVNGANQALEQIHDAAESGNVAQSNLLEKNLAFNLAGHKNHTIFWKNMARPTTRSPQASSRPPLKSSLAPSKASRPTSSPCAQASKAPAGPCWLGMRLASVS